jgi:Lrp/AsnC family leucine-responsive transcriptional regulator
MIFPPRYLSPKAKLVSSSVTVAHKPYDVGIDETDRQILSSIAHDAKASLRDISRETNIPVATLSRRLNELEHRGVFQGYIWQIRPESFSHASFRIYISLRGISAKLKLRLEEFAKEHLNITYLIEWLGSWQYCLGVIVGDSNQATEIVNQVGDILGTAIEQIILVPVVEDVKMKFFPTL